MGISHDVLREPPSARGEVAWSWRSIEVVQEQEQDVKSHDVKKVPDVMDAQRVTELKLDTLHEPEEVPDEDAFVTPSLSRKESYYQIQIPNNHNFQDGNEKNTPDLPAA